MYKFTTLEKWLLTGTVVFGVATITLAIVWPLTKNDDDDNQIHGIPQLTFATPFVLPGRTEKIRVKFHSSYATVPNETSVVAFELENSQLSFSNITKSTTGISVDITRGQLNVVNAQTTTPSFKGCSVYQKEPQSLNVFVQSDNEVLISEFDINQKTYSESKKLVTLTGADGAFADKRLIAISSNQFISGTTLGPFLNAYVVGIDGTSITATPIVDRPASDVLSVCGFQNNIIFIREDGGNRGLYNSVYTDTWIAPQKFFPVPAAANIPPQAVGTYTIPGKPNLLLTVFTNPTSNISFLQGFTQPEKTTQAWESVGSNIELTAGPLTFNTVDGVLPNLYLTENSSGDTVTVAFMSGNQDLVLIRVGRDLRTKKQEYVLLLPGIPTTVYSVINILSYKNQDGAEEVQVMLKQANSVVTVILDSSLNVLKPGGGGIVPIMSAAGVDSFVAATPDLPSGKVQALVQVVPNDRNFKVGIAPWSPSVKINVLSDEQNIEESQ